MIQRPIPRLGALTSGELADLAPATLLVPLGATEQHGPHLPLDTDTTVAEVWADLVAERLNRAGMSTVVAPCLPFGSSGEHQSFPGTLSIGRDALQMVLIELTRSAGAWFRRTVFLSGHAGNLGPLGEAVQQLTVEGHDVVHLVPTWTPNDGFDIDAHAGRTETSLMLHLRPDEVRRPLVGPGDTRPLTELLPALLADGVAAVTATGVLGDPSGAGSQEGRELLQSLVDRTVELLLRRQGHGGGTQYDSISRP